MVWYGMIRYGMVWYGMVWYGMVWYGVTNYINTDFVSLEKFSIYISFNLLQEQLSLVSEVELSRIFLLILEPKSKNQQKNILVLVDVTSCYKETSKVNNFEQSMFVYSTTN